MCHEVALFYLSLYGADLTVQDSEDGNKLPYMKAIEINDAQLYQYTLPPDKKLAALHYAAF